LNARFGRLLGKPTIRTGSETGAVGSVGEEGVMTALDALASFFIPEHQRRCGAIKSAPVSLIVFKVGSRTVLDTNFMQVISVVFRSESAAGLASPVGGIGNEINLTGRHTHFGTVFGKVACWTAFSAHVVQRIGVVSCGTAAEHTSRVDTNVVWLVLVGFDWGVGALRLAFLGVLLFIQSWSYSTVFNAEIELFVSPLS
jgi:hypothetical protein